MFQLPYEKPSYNSKVGDILKQDVSYDIFNVGPAVPQVIRLGVGSIEEADKICNECSASLVIVKRERITKVTRKEGRSARSQWSKDSEDHGN